MRISTPVFFNRGITSIMNTTDRLASVQEQIASGKRVLRPSDDPVAAAKILSLKQEIQAYEQYDKNINFALARLNKEAASLDSVNDEIMRVRDLTIQAGNGALNDSDRASIAQEIYGRIDNLQNLMNTKDVSGEYIFAGFQAKTKPFDTQNGAFVYQGDEGQRFIQVSHSTKVATNDSGRRLFVDIEKALDFTPEIGVANTGSGTVSASNVIDQDDYNEFSPDDAIITFNPITNVVPNGPNFTVTRASDGAVLSGGDPETALQNIAFEPGEAITFEGLSITLEGAPDPGDTVSLTADSLEKQDLLTTFKNIADGLTSLTVGDDLNELLADSLISLDNSQTRILEVQSQVGARLNTIESTEQLNQGLSLTAQEVLANLEDLDLAEAISRLTQEQIGLQAAQSSFARISNLSLFNFLR